MHDRRHSGTTLHQRNSTGPRSYWRKKGRSSLIAALSGMLLYVHWERRRLSFLAPAAHLASPKRIRFREKSRGGRSSLLQETERGVAPPEPSCVPERKTPRQEVHVDDDATANAHKLASGACLCVMWAASFSAKTYVYFEKHRWLSDSPRGKR